MQSPCRSSARGALYSLHSDGTVVEVSGSSIYRLPNCFSAPFQIIYDSLYAGNIYERDSNRKTRYSSALFWSYAYTIAHKLNILKAQKLMLRVVLRCLSSRKSYKIPSKTFLRYIYDSDSLHADIQDIVAETRAYHNAATQLTGKLNGWTSVFEDNPRFAIAVMVRVCQLCHIDYEGHEGYPKTDPKYRWVFEDERWRIRWLEV